MDVFRVFGVTHTQGSEMLRNISSRKRQNMPDVPETRGRKSVISKEKIAEVDHLLETEGIEGRALTWEQLGMSVGLDCSGRTIQRAMGSLEYRKCIACQQGCVNKATAEKRYNWARLMLEQYPLSEDWHRSQIQR
ncbi:MAG: hypothetical protein M1829_006226 [Trizodia sp. TS-e1964]|nr:MAG: hypothetical protein M1829_006226 [Trizodia sp. TS-e1964]